MTLYIWVDTILKHSTAILGHIKYIIFHVRKPFPWIATKIIHFHEISFDTILKFLNDARASASMHMLIYHLE